MSLQHDEYWDEINRMVLGYIETMREDGAETVENFREELYTMNRVIKEDLADYLEQKMDGYVGFALDVLKWTDYPENYFEEARGNFCMHETMYDAVKMMAVYAMFADIDDGFEQYFMAEFVD
jgi:hypothetical protein